MRGGVNKGLLPASQPWPESHGPDRLPGPCRGDQPPEGQQQPRPASRPLPLQAFLQVRTQLQCGWMQDSSNLLSFPEEKGPAQAAFGTRRVTDSDRLCVPNAGMTLGISGQGSQGAPWPTPPPPLVPAHPRPALRVLAEPGTTVELGGATEIDNFTKIPEQSGPREVGGLTLSVPCQGTWGPVRSARSLRR